MKPRPIVMTLALCFIAATVCFAAGLDAHMGTWKLNEAKSRSKSSEALAEIQKEPGPIHRVQGLALAYHASGKKKEAEDALDEYIEKYQDAWAFQVAEIYAYRGETDKAFEWLERAYKQRDAGFSEMKGDPLLRNLESDPRYTAFLKKLELPVD